MSINTNEKKDTNIDKEIKPLVGSNILPQITPQQDLLNQKNTQNSMKDINQMTMPNSTKHNEAKKEEHLNKNLFNTVNGFNPMNHIPPKYDIYGYLKPLNKRIEDMSILTKKDEVKIPWCEKNSN